MILLAVFASVHAASHANTFGGDDDDYVSVDANADCFEVTLGVTVTAVSMYVVRASSTEDAFGVYAWKEASGTWSRAYSATAAAAPSTWGWVSTPVSWPLDAGASYCIGMYTQEDVVVERGTEHAYDDPEWGTILGLGGGSSSVQPGRLYNVDEGGSAKIYMEITVEADDEDGDGYDAIDDCDDGDRGVNPGAAESWYDGVDGDCAGDSDYDQDGDRHDAAAYGGEDCDDEHAEARPGGSETWYDGIDGDCSGGSDYDQDGDGDDGDAHGGGDCDDTDPTRSSQAAEVWYDGIDSDCSGGSDYDQDGDGHDTPSAGGDDCDDTDPTRAEDCTGADTDSGNGDSGNGDSGVGGNDDDDDDDASGGCLCMAATAGPSLAPFLPAVLLALRRRRRA